MHHARGDDVEAPVGFVDHRFDGLLGHAGVVLQLDRAHAARRRAGVTIPHGADKGAHGADTGVAVPQPGHFLRQLEVGPLNAHAGAAPRLDLLHEDDCGTGPALS